MESDFRGMSLWEQVLACKQDHLMMHHATLDEPLKSEFLRQLKAVDWWRFLTRRHAMVAAGLLPPEPPANSVSTNSSKQN